jgi:hypothetical protein
MYPSIRLFLECNTYLKYARKTQVSLILTRKLLKEHTEIADMELKAIIEDRESAISFNTSYIEDLNEKVELEITCEKLFK